jgi:hypothetical protein
VNTKKNHPNGTVAIIRRLFSGTWCLLPGAVVLACAAGGAAPALAQSGDWVVGNLLGSKGNPDIPEHMVTFYCFAPLNGCGDGLLELNQDGELWLNRGDALARLKERVRSVEGFEHMVFLGKKRKNADKLVASDEFCESVNPAGTTGREGQWLCQGVVADDDCVDTSGNTCGEPDEEVPIRTMVGDQGFCDEAQSKVDEALGAGTRSVAWAVRHDLAKAGEEKATTIITCPGYSIQPTPPRTNLNEAHFEAFYSGVYTPHGCIDGYC